MTSKMGISANELKKGDRFTISHRDLVFDHVSVGGQGVIAGDGRFYNILPETVIVLLSRATVLPEHFPPQEGDVWQIGATYYHILGQRAYTGSVGVPLSEFNDKTRRGQYKPVLVYRRGNQLR